MRSDINTRRVDTLFGRVGVEGNLRSQRYEELSNGHRRFLKTSVRISELTCESRFLYDATSFRDCWHKGKQES